MARRKYYSPTPAPHPARVKGAKKRPSALFAMDFAEVAREWNRMSGENISRTRVWQILKTAERKLAEALEDLARERGIL